MTDEPDPPVLDAYYDSTGGSHVWCDHEQVWHLHGHCDGRCRPRAKRRVVLEGTPCECPQGTGDGHRVAHCGCRVGYPDGYILREVGRYTATVKATHKQRRSGPCPGAECVAERAAAAERAWRFAYGQDVLEVACPKCYAEIGTKCVMRRGHVHSARYDARMQARRLRVVP